MKIKEFSKLFKEAGDSEKISLIKEHIITKYLPYERKMALCKNVIDSADYTSNINLVNKKYYSPNTPMRFVFFCMSVVNAYTDLEWEKVVIDNEEKNDVIGGFNILDEIGVFEILFNELDREYNILNTIQQMMIDDTYKKENSLVAFLATKYDSIEALCNVVMPIIEEKIINFPKKEN